MTKLYLASASPRRHELLEQVGMQHEVVGSTYDEPNTDVTDPVRMVKAQALGKARCAVGIPSGPQLVLGADTIVVFEGRVLGKPKSKEEAKEMLRMLSGQQHSVITGVALLYGPLERVFSVETVVNFRKISETEIAAYVATGEPMDKAGAYGIQGIGALWVSGIVGSYTNVVGLPVEAVYATLQDML